MRALLKKLILNPIFYVTRDIERVAGLDLHMPGLFIISNYSNFAKRVAGQKKNVFLVKEKKILDTWELLQNQEVRQYVTDTYESTKLKNVRNCENTKDKPNIVVFKNTTQIEKICQHNNWRLLNPPARLANQIEEKISQVNWAGELKKYFPPYKILLCKNIPWTGRQFILQFNRSHTGSGTILVKTNQQLEKIKAKFPKREARLASYIDGPLFTNNNLVWGDKILLGNISYQITGLKPFTDLRFATIGNDWALPNKILTKQQIKQYQTMAQAVGKKMAQSGWRGLYGVDIVLETKTGKMYLVEINARQPASASFESQLQSQLSPANDKRITTMAAHLASLLGIKIAGQRLIKITNGAQLVYRVNDRQTAKDNQLVSKKLLTEKLKVIQYDNTKPNSDLLRIQTEQGVMAGHNVFNQLGKKIVKILYSNPKF